MIAPFNLYLFATPIRKISYIRAAILEPLSLGSRSFHSQWKDYGFQTIPAFGPYGRHRFPIRCNSMNYVKEVLHYINQTDPLKTAQHYTHPVELFYGKFDGIAPIQDGILLKNTLPNSRLHTFWATHLSLLAKAKI